MYYILFISFSTLIGWLFYWHNECRRKFSSMSNIPGPKPLPFIGNVLEFGFNPVEKLKNLQRISNTYGPLAKIWISHKNLYLIVTDPEFSELILSCPKYIKKAADYDILNSWLGKGLLVSSGSYWQKRRKIITPAFHFKILEDFITVFNNESNKLIQRLAKNVDNEIDINPYITACTLDIICESAMGTSVKAQDNFDNEYVKAVKTMCHIFIDRIFSSWKQFDTLFQFSSDFKRQTEALNIIHGFTKSVIEKRRQKLLTSNNSVVKDDDDHIGTKKKLAFLDVLLQATVDDQPLSDEDIREEVDTFMFEGHDTIASLLAFSMYELARNPDVQHKVYTEIKELYGGDKNFQPKLQDLNEMKYTELVIKEVLRLYPSVPYISRSLEEDVHFKGTLFPKDLRIVIFMYAMHRRSDLFPEPDKFNPDRFLTKNTESPFSYLPFSAGPRNCIGQKFAMYEAKSTISKILMHFELLPADSKYDIILSGEVVLKTANGVHILLKQRQ